MLSIIFVDHHAAAAIERIPDGFGPPTRPVCHRPNSYHRRFHIAGRPLSIIFLPSRGGAQQNHGSRVGPTRRFLS